MIATRWLQLLEDMARHFWLTLCLAAAFAVLCYGTQAAEPRVANSRYKLELIAEQPQIVTPIGAAFDRRGRLLIIESHTHQRPKEYAGPSGDRIRMVSDSDGDGKLDRWTTFAEGFRHAMNLLVRADGAVYVVMRHGIVLLRDTNNDCVADKQEEILKLESASDYPHNGLSGITFQADGRGLVIGMGENFGFPYRLVGSDGKTLSGSDGAGLALKCGLDGGGLEKIAVGFWNPFSVCVLQDGRIFAVDNDPDASPPCRMVHIVWGGDYGFRYQYGRAGTHPLQAWNGELPGTMPYVIGVGEAPTALVAHGGALWVTSWGDHRIERYELLPRGASYGATREIIVQGDTDFRPTGMAVAPDGSLYFGDWVLKDYPVHGHGRLWRLTLPADEVVKTFPAAAKASAAVIQNGGTSENDAFLNAAKVKEMVDSPDFEKRGLASLEAGSEKSADARLEALEALRLGRSSQAEAVLRRALNDDSENVRLFAVRWISDERMTSMRDDVAKLLDGPQPSERFYLAVLGALEWLDNKPGMRAAGITDKLLVRELEDDRRSPELHALALRLLKPTDKFLTLDRLKTYLESKYVPLRLEAVRTLSQQTSSQRFKVMASVARDAMQNDEVRAEAIVGLSADAAQNCELLKELSAENKSKFVRTEASRALRLAGLQPAEPEPKPAAADIAAWKKLMNTTGDSSVGRRIFFSPVAARCYVCHKYEGRGGNIGPDLTRIGQSTTREKIVASILQPSREIAPDFQPWVLQTTDGKTYTGLRLPKPGDDGKEDYADAAGNVFTLRSIIIEERTVSTTSIMPENLQAALSIADMRDLITFLTGGETKR